ncbi:MAG: hypothetical protein OEV44_11310 [Spirochaetota bacterium]|nr:hypothetical protein [Spirochaetota bacterium]
MEKIKKLIRQSLFYYKLFFYLQNKLDLLKWYFNKKQIAPPHIIKFKIVKEFAIKYSLTEFIETGTYLGNMIFSAKDLFKKIISIEIDKTLYLEAVKRFNNYPNIFLMQGDSGEILKEAISNIGSKKALFWLDGHYSGGVTGKGNLNTSILNELNTIFDHSKEHVILIDDARCFTGQSDYPTLETLKEFVLKKKLT